MGDNSSKFDIALGEAKAYLRITAPFFASLCASSPITEDESVETACVNETGWIRVNPSFFLSLGLTERAVLLSHEIMHPAWGVFWRSKSLSHNPLLSNVAHDHVVNLILSGSYPDWSIPGWLCDPKYQSLSYEEVYAQVSKSPPETSTQNKRRHNTKSSPPLGGIGADLRPDGTGPLDTERDEGLWRTRILAATQTARSMGSLPMALERSISELLDPEIDWRQSLFLSVTAALGKNALNWGIPHRRSDALGIHMPLEEELGYDVSVAVDTSGSVSKENLRRACSEIAGIIQSAGGQGRFLVGDASVNCDIPLAEFDATLLEGGGGTDFDPVFRHLEDHPTRLLVYFTDTWGNFPATEPSFPVVWAVYASAISAGAKVPFGEIVQIPDE